MSQISLVSKVTCYSLDTRGLSLCSGAHSTSTSYPLGNRDSLALYKGVSKSFWTEMITKYTLTIINTCCEATKRVVVAKVTRLAHKIVIQLHLVAESCTIFSSCSRQPVQKLLNTPLYMGVKSIWSTPTICIHGILLRHGKSFTFFIITKCGRL
jgi:hypothetical protein